MLRTPDTGAASVLASLADPAVIVRECEHRLRSVSAPNLGSDPTFTRTRQLDAVIHRAEMHASAQASTAVDTRHLLQGVVDDVDAMAYEILVAGKVSPGAVSEALLQS